MVYLLPRGDVTLRELLPGFRFLWFSSVNLFHKCIILVALRPMRADISRNESSPIIRPCLNFANYVWHIAFSTRHIDHWLNIFHKQNVYTDFNAHAQSFTYKCYAGVLRALLGLHMHDCSFNTARTSCKFRIFSFNSLVVLQFSEAVVYRVFIKESPNFNGII